MRRILAFLLSLAMLSGLALPASAAQADWESAMDASLGWIRSAVSPNPLVGSVGGEWAVIALARANRVTTEDPWVSAWLANLEETLTEVDRLSASYDIQNPPSVGTFPPALRRWTDFQRVTLALSALGLDASAHNGRNLTEIFSEFIAPAQRHALNQTINVDIFALIALNTLAYPGGRDFFINSLLDSQRADGSWSLSPDLPSSPFDVDITAMSIQALAPHYHSNTSVASAVDNALHWLQTQSFTDPEGVAQMIVALTALGPDFAHEAESFVEQLLTWFDPESGGFRRPTPADPVNHMATEQAAYALVAYWRFVNNMSPLYDMRDTLSGPPAQAIASAPQAVPSGMNEMPGIHADVQVPGIFEADATFTDIQGHDNMRAIEALAARGIIWGRTSTSFEPDATMTRAEFAAVITNSLGLPARSHAQFEDIPPGAWFSGAVATAFYYEIVNGTTESLFNPGGTITRQEAAVMVKRGARLAGMNTALTETETRNILAMFGDYQASAGWAWAALAFCYREGILDDAQFYIHPTSVITRGEIAEMLYRMLSLANNWGEV